jgi:5-hydroxyisourate hydrolase
VSEGRRGLHGAPDASGRHHVSHDGAVAGAAGDAGGPGATVSTHVLDATAGTPAAGVDVALAGWEADGSWRVAERGRTGADGRYRFAGRLAPGDWRLTFGTGAYFEGRGTASFYPEVTIAFRVSAGHHHVPLLLSPFAYSTYRGS